MRAKFDKLTFINRYEYFNHYAYDDFRYDTVYCLSAYNKLPLWLEAVQRKKVDSQSKDSPEIFSACSKPISVVKFDCGQTINFQQIFAVFIVVVVANKRADFISTIDHHPLVERKEVKYPKYKYFRLP